ncbi:hypothetical protein AV656_06620 [Bhargavaea cecembensis]|uniref:DUF2207 domain-containing protein n=1 Tax=Bhargavaea cecembensis TaxID=394098 RepID=A0A165H2D2_9BACL|nr:DUF2207 domain-containing protein [Bhargavaea cecembensis]KZE38575.1 hypothetical protein AV656_06620 [Bhargavaea cecembensis]
MKSLIRIAWILLFLLLLFPTASFAVEFEITDSRIDARADHSGNVSVTEFHTYEFKGDFNGVTRTLIPKDHTKITGFSAFEDGQPLKTEMDGDLYKIFRGGEDERVTVELHYQIEGAITRYEDGAEFYWPFFDDRNEADYGNMTINVAPPEPASGTEVIGYDEAADTGRVEQDGTAKFILGHVGSGENGDIRVVFDGSLFPSLNAVPGTIRDKIATEQNRLTEELAAAEERHRNAVLIGNIVLPAAFLLLLGVFLKERNLSRRKLAEARRQAEALGFRTPDEIVSMPAAIQFMSPAIGTGPERLSAALLDLIRKGQVVQESATRFEETDKTPEHKQEEILRSFLFDSFGDGTGGFDLEQLKSRTEDDEQAGEYSNRVAEWSGTVSLELKEAGLKEAHPGTSVILALIGSILAGIAIYFGMGEAWIHLGIAIPPALAALIGAAFYRPLSDKGHLLREQWQFFSGQFKISGAEEWTSMPREDRLRGYIYAIGTKNKDIDLPFAKFADTRQSSSDIPPAVIVYDPLVMNRSFAVAGEHAAYSSSASSSSSGGGVGGGGGGSGAF